MPAQIQRLAVRTDGSHRREPEDWPRRPAAGVGADPAAGRVSRRQILLRFCRGFGGGSSRPRHLLRGFASSCLPGPSAIGTLATTACVPSAPSTSIRSATLTTATTSATLTTSAGDCLLTAATQRAQN
jgi:hypothetical protein